MKNLLRLLIVVCTCTAFTACTSLRTVMDTQAGLAPPIQPPLASGDDVTITTRDGMRTQVVLTSVAADIIEGRASKGAAAGHFDLAEVVKIERRELDGVKTTFLVIAIAAGVYAIGLAAANASLSGSL